MENKTELLLLAHTPLFVCWMSASFSVVYKLRQNTLQKESCSSCTTYKFNLLWCWRDLIKWIQRAKGWSSDPTAQKCRSQNCNVLLSKPAFSSQPHLSQMDKSIGSQAIHSQLPAYFGVSKQDIKLQQQSAYIYNNL